MHKNAFFVKNALNCSKIMDIMLDFVNELVYNSPQADRNAAL